MPCDRQIVRVRTGTTRLLANRKPNPCRSRNPEPKTPECRAPDITRLSRQPRKAGLPSGRSPNARWHCVAVGGVRSANWVEASTRLDSASVHARALGPRRDGRADKCGRASCICFRLARCDLRPFAALQSAADQTTETGFRDEIDIAHEAGRATPPAGRGGGAF